MKSPRLHSSASLLLALAGAGCFVNTQRIPGPMVSRQVLPPGASELYPAGPEEVLVIRLADPTRVAPAGHTRSYPLAFFRKQVRLNSGSWVGSDPGGRLEVLWPNTANVVLFGEGVGVIGSPSRGEPIFLFREVDRAEINLVDGGPVELLGGALLSASTGPFVLEHPSPAILRIRNRSKGMGRIAFRDEVFDLDPGYMMNLPLLEVGARPFQRDPDFKLVGPEELGVLVRGDVVLVPDPRGVRLQAVGDHEIRANGVRVRLDPGEEVLFGDLEEVPEVLEEAAAEDAPAEDAPEDATGEADPGSAAPTGGGE